jgi:uncharacterized protein (DUF305 family)
MKNKILISNLSLVSLVASGTLTGLLPIDRAQAQTQATSNNPSLLAQTQPQRPGQGIHHPQGSPNPSSTRMGMMMNQQQVDQHFIQMMIPHHQGAVDMANLALSKATHPELKKLAQSIKTSQTQEIQEMKGWYKKWYGTDVPVTSSRNMPMHSGTGMNQGMPNNAGWETDMMQMMGMMNMDLTALKKAPNFDQVFVEQMIPHHQMAVMMAAMVLDSPHPELRNLGKAIIQTQSTEIEQMLQWQKAWSQ